jgi:predicted amidohydrolase
MINDKLLTVAAVQMKSVQGDVICNHLSMERFVRTAAKKGARLIGLPELWSTGYHLSAAEFKELAQLQDGPTVLLAQKLARELNVVLIVPFPEKDLVKNINYISCAVIDQDGAVLGIHRKSFLWGNEKEKFTAGPFTYEVYSTGIGKIGVLICYDIEFPEPARILSLGGAELIICPSVWSNEAKRRWEIQLPARALDNQCFVIGINTVDDGACGRSVVISPMGEIINEAQDTGEELLVATLDLDEITLVRERLPYLKDLPKPLKLNLCN